MTHLMKERFNLSELHQTRSSVDRGGLVEYHMRDRKPNLFAIRSQKRRSSNDGIHPGASSLLRGPRVGVEVKVGLGLSGFGVRHLVEHDRLVPEGGSEGRFFNFHVEQAFDEVKKPNHHLGEGEVWPEFLLVEVVLVLPHLLRVVPDIPLLQRILDLELVSCERVQLLMLLLRGVERSRAKVFEEAERLGQGRHFACQRDIRVVIVAEKGRFL
mmetsp:Transcript_13603/g.24584  ORF Transcript_13603/g.24584 Transcript_13603/m.24584 type:complete len:213 (-) Transcript_13603:1192-1830(-)